MPTKLDTRQSVNRSALSMVGSAANDSLDTILPKIDAELAKLFEDRNVTLVDGGNISFTGTTVTFTQTLKLVLNSKISGAAPQVISLGSSTRTLSADGKMVYAVIDRGAGTAVVTDDATSLPSVTSANQEVFLIAYRSDSGDGTVRVYFRDGTALNTGESTRLGSPGTTPPVDSMELINLGISTSVGANALTVALKQADGSTDATAASPVRIAFRSSTLTTGASIERSITGALSLVVPSGATLGTENGVAAPLYLYAIDNAGTVELAISGSGTWDERTLVSTTVLDTSSDNRSDIYSTTARSNVPLRLIGRIFISEATAGTWATNATERYAGAIKNDPTSFDSLINIGLASSVAANALTVALKQSDSVANGAPASPIRIVFRNSTAVNSTPVERQVTAALTITVPSGATLGHVSGFNEYIYVYALDFGGTVELAVSSSNFWDERILNSTTVLDTSSDSRIGLYSTTARSNVPIRLIGRLIISEATAGTWATNATGRYIGNLKDDITDTSTTPGNIVYVPNSGNMLINANARISQRQDMTTAPVALNALLDTSLYFVDRFQALNVGLTSAQVTAQAITGDTPSGFDLGNSIKIAATATNASARLGCIQSCDDAVFMRGKIVTVKCWVKSNNANARIAIFDTSGIIAISDAVPATSTWTEVTISGRVGTGATDLFFTARLMSGGNGNVSITSGDFIQIYFPVMYTGTKFPGYTLAGGGHPANEFNLCLRYFEKFIGSYFWTQIAYQTNSIDFQVQFTEKRTSSPTVSMKGTVNTDYVVYNQNGGGSQAGFGTFTFSGITSKGVDITAPKNAHGLTQAGLRLLGSTGQIWISAEL